MNRGTGWDDWLAEQAAARDDAGLTRVLRPRAARPSTVDLAGNDYLGLARDKRVRAAASAAADEWGAGAGASRLVTGTLQLHTRLERALAEAMGQPEALVFSSGYTANLALVTSLADRDAHIISDAHVHASLIDAARLSRAEVTVTPHNDTAAVREALTADPGRRTLILAESIYSVLGDEAPLVELADLCAEFGAWLVVDEAHGLGVRGTGLVARHGLHALPHVIVTATLSKALGSQGGAVLGSSALIEHVINRARPFIFDTALAPAATAGALAALDVMQASPHLPGLIRRRVDDLADALGVEASAGAVLSVPMPSPEAAVNAADEAASRRVRVGCFRPPSVPDGVSRLRITANAGVRDAEWEFATSVLQDVVKRAHGG